MSYNDNTSEVFTLQVDEKAGILFAGEDNNFKGKVVKYNLTNGDLITDYGSLGIKAVLSSARIHILCFFGGWKSHSFRIIDTFTDEILFDPIKTAIKYIDSIEICHVEDNKTKTNKYILVVAGRYPNYANNATDI